MADIAYCNNVACSKMNGGSVVGYRKAIILHKCLAQTIGLGVLAFFHYYTDFEPFFAASSAMVFVIDRRCNYCLIMDGHRTKLQQQQQQQDEFQWRQIILSVVSSEY